MFDNVTIEKLLCVQGSRKGGRKAPAIGSEKWCWNVPRREAGGVALEIWTPQRGVLQSLASLWEEVQGKGQEHELWRPDKKQRLWPGSLQNERSSLARDF